MPPNPQIKRILVPWGEMTLDAPYVIQEIQIRNDGDPGDIYLNCWCGSDPSVMPEYPDARGRRLANYDNLGHMQTVYFSGTFYLTDEYALQHGQTLGLCGGCNPDGDCWPDPSGGTPFRYEVGYFDAEGNRVPTHSIWRMSLLTVLPPAVDKGYLTVQTLLNNEAPVHAEVYLDGEFIGYGDGGVNALPLDPGTYTVSFGDRSSWITPADVNVTIVSGEETVVTGSYVQVINPGIIIVDTTPVNGDIFIDGAPIGTGHAQWQVAPGTHVVSFGDVAGYTKPANISVTVAVYETVSVVGTYTPIIAPLPGVLTISTAPIAGQIFINGQSVGVGSFSDEVDSGSYTVSFGSVAGYTTPENITVFVGEGEEVTVTGTYVEIVVPQTGTLTVNTNPVSGQIFLNGQSIGAGVVTVELDAGNYTVSFGDVADYLTPSDIQVNIQEGDITTVTGTYVAVEPPITGTLAVITSPISGDIYIDGNLEGTGSVTLELPPAIYTISFGDVAGYTKPDSISVNVAADNQYTKIGYYTEVEVTPEEGGIPWWLIAGGVALGVMVLSKDRR